MSRMACGHLKLVYRVELSILRGCTWRGYHHSNSRGPESAHAGQKGALQPLFNLGCQNRIQLCEDHMSIEQSQREYRTLSRLIILRACGPLAPLLEAMMPARACPIAGGYIQGGAQPYCEPSCIDTAAFNGFGLSA